MQCEIRAMSDIREGGRSSRVSDTLPKRGRVNEGKLTVICLNYFC